MSRMAQHAILRFEKHKGNPARPLEAHHERQKEQYASNPDIDTSRSKYNFHIVKPEGRYYHFIQSRIEQAGCRTRKDSTRFVDTLITASPEFFKGKSPKEMPHIVCFRAWNYVPKIVLRDRSFGLLFEFFAYRKTPSGILTHSQNSRRRKLWNILNRIEIVFYQSQWCVLYLFSA